MSKRIWLLVVISVVSLSVFPGCWDSGGDSEGQKLKILMIADGDYNDHSFNQACREGLERAEQNFWVKADFEIIDNMNMMDTESMLDQFNLDDYDLVIANGYFFAEAVRYSAAEYPNARFAIVDYSYEQVPENVNCIVFNADEAAFALGYLGTAWAEIQDPDNPVIAYVGGMDIPPVRQWTDPFCTGADYYNTIHRSAVVCEGDFATDFYDEAQGSAIADSLITDGADVIFGCGGLTGNAGIAEAKANGKWGIGVDRDMYEGMPSVQDILLSSGIKRFDNGVYAAVQAMVDGAFDGGGTYRGNLLNGGVMLAPYHDYADDLPASLKNEIDTIIEGIKDGTIDTGWDTGW